MNQSFTKEMVGNHQFHPLLTVCLGYQSEQHFDLTFVRPKDASLSRRVDHVAVAEDWYEPMGKTLFTIRKGQFPFVPCVCFGLAYHGEPEIQKSIDGAL